MSNIIEAFSLPFMQSALLAGCLIATVCAYLGVYLVLKRMVFVGVALSEVAAVGIALGMLLGLNPSVGAFVLVFVGIFFFWVTRKFSTLTPEGLIGFGYAFAASLSILLVAKIPMAEAEGLNLLQGNLLFATQTEILQLAVTGAVILCLHLLLYRRILFCSFDRDTARTMGLNAEFYDLLIYVTLGAMIAISMKVAGIVFVFASMIVPALTGLLLSRRLWLAFVISGLFAPLCVVAGVYLSYVEDLPTGPSIVGIYGVFFLLIVFIKGPRIVRQL